MKRFLMVLGILSFGIAAGYYSLIWATEKRLLPAGVQERTEAQVYSQYGLAATARPETAAPLSAIAERPWVGWGSTAYDPVIWRYYIDLLTENWRERTDFRTIYQDRSEEHTSELQSLMRISYAVFCLKKKNQIKRISHLSLADIQ